jgi:hypothetical protein
LGGGLKRMAVPGTDEKLMKDPPTKKATCRLVRAALRSDASQVRRITPQ